MKAVSDLRLCKPISLVRIYKNKQLERTVTNAVTVHGLDEIMKSTEEPLVDENGGRLSKLFLGSGTTPITFETNEPANVITATGLVTTAEVVYRTEGMVRYGYANLIYRFENPVNSEEPLRQVMIISPSSPDRVLFGLSLNKPIDISDNAIIDIVYTIRFPVLSTFKPISEGSILGVDFSLHGKFASEGTNLIQYNWPADTDNVEDTETTLSQFYVNDDLLPVGSGRYRSDRWREGYRYIQRIYTRVYGDPPGDLIINKFEYGAVIDTENSYTIRLMTPDPLLKNDNQVFDLEILLIIKWTEPEGPGVPEVYAAVFPQFLYTI